MDQNQTAKQSIIDRLQQATNVLVTVKSNPSVDQLAACIGFTLFLNKLGKHATAVFSGKIPSTLEFLKPEETIEKNTDSLRDFIIALDKAKADKLRYKVEDTVVKIFITPYKSSLGQKDLEFSQGDFNVDVVVALGVQSKSDIDNAITAHGRILHDATVIAINNGIGGNIATLNLEDNTASSLSEMLVDLSEAMQPDSFDAQMATAYLTGIVAETKRFSNDKTSARTMSLSAKLMAAGANQQLIATKLQPSMVAGGKDLATGSASTEDAKDDAGTLHIEHESEAKGADAQEPEEGKTLAEIEQAVAPDKAAKEPQLPPVEDTAPSLPSISPASQAMPTPSVTPTTGAIGDVKSLPDTDMPSTSAASKPAEPQVQPRPGSNMAYEPPTMGGTLTANSRPQDLEPSIDPLSAPSHTQKTLEHTQSTLGATPQTQGQPVASANLDAARQAVEDAAKHGTQDRFEPLAAVGSQPLDMDVQGVHNTAAGTASPVSAPVVPQSTDTSTSAPANPMAQPSAPTQLPTSLVPPDTGLPPEQTAAHTPPQPPPVPPPPMMPPA
ncbi:hypothetical protein KC951_03870 [Candidatus Saccharibacteria bacterium]|nr:hypothetical protein [Candidatus Saccharibacteria bacterium]